MRSYTIYLSVYQYIDRYLICLMIGPQNFFLQERDSVQIQRLSAGSFSLLRECQPFAPLGSPADCVVLCSVVSDSLEHDRL